ncbi:MAG TPA: glycosyltransferase family 4 protein [Verrucomicrobiae bacterium]|jgi:glycosyltransferase involved in cell wall biosynthesis
MQAGQDVSVKAPVNGRRLKIGISIWSFTPGTGGLQAHAEALCHHLQERGHEVTVITRSATRVPRGGDYLFFNESPTPISVAGIPVSPLRVDEKWNPLLWVVLKSAAHKPVMPLAARLFETAFAEPAGKVFAGFDIIHHVGHATALMGLATARAARRNGTPFLVQPTAHPFHFGDSGLDFRLYRQADRLLVHTGYEQSFFQSSGINCPIDVVYNGIEDRTDGQGGRFLARYEIEGPMILYIGRKAVDKGYPLVIEAFKRLRTNVPAAVLVCLGPKDPDSVIEKVPGVVELDFVSEQEKHDALAACTCLCVPSVGESFGLVYMEAGRYRKPVIGRNLPVLRELLGAKAAMLLGQPDESRNMVRLSVEELVSGIFELINNPDLCRQLGDACHQQSEKFLWPNIVRRFEESYYSSLQPGKKESNCS